jgi:hypothetical protein
MEKENRIDGQKKVVAVKPTINNIHITHVIKQTINAIDG